MMSCDKVHGLLGSWYDHELEPELIEHVDRHVAGCHECAAAVARWRRLDDLLGLETGVPGFAAEVLESVRRDRPATASWWARVAAVAVLALGLGGLAASTAMEGDSSPATEVVTLQELEASFGPESLAGIDHIATGLGRETSR